MSGLLREIPPGWSVRRYLTGNLIDLQGPPERIGPRHQGYPCATVDLSGCRRHPVQIESPDGRRAFGQTLPEAVRAYQALPAPMVGAEEPDPDLSNPFAAPNESFRPRFWRSR